MELDLPGINVARLLREGGSVTAQGTLFGSLTSGIHSLPIEHLDWKVEVQAVGYLEFWLSARLKGVALLECSRCLEPAPTPLEAHFETLLRYQAGLKEPELLEEEDEDILLFGNPQIDLSPILYEAFSLELPLTALCRPDCQGLCPVCGANLNLHPCGHSQSHLAHPLISLKGLL